jgi:hypothetical protein
MAMILLDKIDGRLPWDQDLLFLVFLAAAIGAVGMVLQGDMFSQAPTKRVYAKKHKIRTQEEKRDFFKKVGVEYIDALLFSKECEAFQKNPLLEINNAFGWQCFYRATSMRYGPFVARKYVAPVYIQWIDNNVGYGLFAEQDFAKGDFLMEYMGMVVKRTMNAAFSWSYAFSSDFRNGRCSIDALEHGNEARFSNHGENPNMETEFVYQDECWHLIYVAKSAIKEGEELLIDYGPGYWKRKEHLPLRTDLLMKSGERKGLSPKE